MNRLVGRKVHARGLEERVPAATTGRNWLVESSLAFLCVVAATAFAQDTSDPQVPPAPATLTPAPTLLEPSDPQTQLMTVIEPKYEMDPTSLSPLGDDFNPATGTVSFSATDISIPGNFAIPVELRRWIPSDDADTGGPAGWKWNIPFIRGNYLDVRDGHTSTGWDWGNPDTWRNGKNCTGSADTVIDNAGELIAANAYWQGKRLHIPGVTSETFVTTSSGEQVTKSHFKIIDSLCINDNPPDEQGIVQQGIVVKGPDGTTYTFNQVKNYFNRKVTLKGPIVRTRLLMITKIKDRFNNEVNYGYDAEGRLTSIRSSDERQIDITYQNGEVYQASAHGRTWTYGAGSVTLPDGRQWNYAGLSALAFKPNGIGGYEQRFQYGLDPSTGATLPTLIPGCGVASDYYTASITSPDGLQTTYTFQDTVHYRSKVELDVYADRYQNYLVSRALYCTIARSLVSKVVSGPGVGPYTWNYVYSRNHGTYKSEDPLSNSVLNSVLAGPFDLPTPIGGYPAPIVAGGGAVNYRSVTVRGPDKQSVFYIDRQFQSISEERVVAQDTLNAAGTQLLERSESSFGLGAEVGMHWYMCPCDGMYPPINENQLSHHINQTQARRIRYVNNSADATFTAEYPPLKFDERGRPTVVTRSSSVAADSRTERILYEEDNTSFGVMGQVKRITIDGIIRPMVEHKYDLITAQRTSTTKFDVLQAEYEYHPDGNLWKHIDGLGQATTYTDYHRGQPRRIERADSASETAEVNDWGLVTGRVDPYDHSWSYRYDDALRLEAIVPPTGWTSTAITHERATGPDYGLPTGHWRQTVDKGNARIVTYFDVLWRPLMVRSYDTSNEANTRKVVVKTFDVGGQPMFESYPQREFATVAVSSPGHRMQYDALGRPTRLEADSETGVRVTKTDYLSGFQTRVTNPRNKITTQSLWALDDPDKAQLAAITAPEDVHVAITRNLLGNPTSIRRWGNANGVSADVTRSYVYHVGDQRLCKTLEPEVIATAQGYDGAGNIAWRASGVNLSGNSCELEASVPSAKKISYTYDPVNQLKTVTYGDGSPGIARTYTKDGLLETIDSNGALWSYKYNSLRKPTTEELTYGGKKYNFGWAYDANGNLSALAYPTGGPNATYLPNAQGEPSQVGNYATNIAFHPNGAISGFTFGNNIVHSLTQTVEGTPKLNSDGTVLQDLYTYDGNGNVSTITDQRSSPIDGKFSRTMTYDDLDRLAGVSAPGVWSSASYLYDPVDNLRTAIVGPRISTLNYGTTTNRLDSVITNGTSTAYDYDGNGNIWHKGGQTYTFDLGNRLASAPLGSSYAYDGHGRRTNIASGDGTTQIQVYSQGGQLLWSEKNGIGTFPATVSYGCSTGTLVGQQCLTTSTYAATIGMSCNAGDSLSGSTCTHTSTYSATASYSCPSGGSLSGNICSRNDSYAASVSYTCNGGDTLSGSACTHTSTYTATASYSCPSGGSLSGTNCSRNDSYAASVNYSCNGGDALSGSSCTHTSTYTATASYSCPSGGSLSGTTCSRNDNYAASVNYTCNAGDPLNGSTCTRTNYVAASVSYSCPSGYTLSGATCSTTISTAATTSYSCNGLTSDGAGYCNGAGTLAYSYDEAYDACLAQGNSYGLSLETITYISGKRYNCVFQANTLYSCPNGGTLNGAQCVSTSSQPATASYSCSAGTLTGTQCAVPQTYTATTNYSCPNGDPLSGSTCLKTTVYTATAAYSCPSGGSLNGSTCTQTSAYTATSNYSCPSGGTLSGSTCLKTTDYAATAAYSCPGGGSLGGTTCTQTSSYTATSNYSCPSGGTLSGSSCLKTTDYAATAAYSCPSGGSLSGSNCTLTNSYTATSNYSCTGVDTLNGSTCTHTSASAATPGYSCSNGGTLSGSQCVGTTLARTAYIYLGGKQIAETVIDGTTQYVHTDALGSPVAHTNQAGAELNRTKFEPYGYTAAGTKPGTTVAGLTTTGSAIGFTGHVNDPETDLVYMQQRYYDPVAGRFLSVDPVVTDANTGGSFNRYAYANNSPYKYVDPDGRNPAAIPAGVGGTLVCGPVCGGIAAGTVLIGGTYAGKKIVDWWNSRSEPKRSDSEKKPSLVDEKGEKHILDGDKTGGGHRPGTGSPGKSEFPTNWSDEKILGEISDVATAPDSTHSPGKGGRTISTGTRDGVDITTVTEPGSKGGRIVTGFPTNVPRNPPPKPTSNTP